jgi:NADH-quinone oxidoreductase subunit G
MDTVILTIDGRQMTVPKGQTILQAAIEHGIQIPFYCYHPGIGVDGSCRVCIVRVEKMPKLQTACSTVCTDGMVVDTRSPEVVAARASVFEFLLINHPLDCPVCDKGGECPLQDYSYTFGNKDSRMEFPRRVFDGEGVKADVDFGPTLLLNRNRCILCTRCVRFMKVVDGDAQISIVDRGYGSEIATFQEEGVHSLLSGNLADVCPVGAITTKDYRFKSRPWVNLAAADTICTLCSKGCNTTAWVREKREWAKGPKLVRFTPRLNPDVNGYWMCDIGRFGYHWIEGDGRLRTPLVRDAQGSVQQASWPDALAKVAEKVGAASGAPASGLRFLLSAHVANEEIFLVKQLAHALSSDEGDGRIAVSWRNSDKQQPATTAFTVPATDAPNVNGARDFGLQVGEGNRGRPDVSALRNAVAAGHVPALFVLDPGPDGSIGDVSWILEARRSGALPFLVVQGVTLSALAQAADIVLPGASNVEKDATYTNDQGRAQAAARSLAPPFDAREDWQILVSLAATLRVPMPYSTSTQVRADIAASMPDKSGYSTLNEIVFRRPVPARSWLQVSNPSERWKWDFLYQDLPPVKFAKGSR